MQRPKGFSLYFQTTVPPSRYNLHVQYLNKLYLYSMLSIAWREKNYQFHCGIAITYVITLDIREGLLRWCLCAQKKIAKESGDLNEIVR